MDNCWGGENCWSGGSRSGSSTASCRPKTGGDLARHSCNSEYREASSPLAQMREIQRDVASRSGRIKIHWAAKSRAEWLRKISTVIEICRWRGLAPRPATRRFYPGGHAQSKSPTRRTQLLDCHRGVIAAASGRGVPPARRPSIIERLATDRSVLKGTPSPRPSPPGEGERNHAVVKLLTAVPVAAAP